MTLDTSDKSLPLRAYLLGQLNEASMAELEDRMLGDSELFDRLECELDDLDDDYLSGRLLPAERQQYVARHAGHPDGMARLAFARALEAHQREVGMVAPPPRVPISFLGQLTGLVRRQRPALQWALAAVTAVVVLGPSVAVLRVNQLGRDLEVLRGDLALQGQRADAAGAAAAAAQAGRLAAEQRLSDLTTVSFDLLPGMSRGSAALTVGTTADLVRVRLALEAPLAGAEVRVELQDASGATAWSATLDSTATRDPAALQVTMPGAALAPGEYLLRVSTRQAGSAAGFAEVAIYAFRMRRR